MTEIGTMMTKEPIENAQREIKRWLEMIGISGLYIDMRYDAKSNVALVRFTYEGKNYEFRSTNQKNCRLNMWGIARVMEYKVRSHLMGIETFQKSMVAYLMIENKSGYNDVPSQSMQVNERNYIILGLSPLASNDEIRKKYKDLMKSYHPDMALSELAKQEFEKRTAEINQAYAEIKKERGFE